MASWKIHDFDNFFPTKTPFIPRGFPSHVMFDYQRVDEIASQKLLYESHDCVYDCVENEMFPYGHDVHSKSRGSHVCSCATCLLCVCVSASDILCGL